MNIKILYDHQIFTNQMYGGISRYFTEIMEHMYDDNEISCIFPHIFSNNYYIKKSNIIKNRSFFNKINFKGKYRLSNIINKRLSKRYILKNNYNIFHPTYYDIYFLDYIDKKPFVLTIHDMIHDIYPEMFPRKDKTVQWKELLATRAVAIIAVSESTKKDITKYLGIRDDKIHVIYHGSSITKHNEDRDMYELLNLPNEYLLYVGSRDGYKNFILFIEAIAHFLKNNKNLHVICAGGHFLNNSESKMLEEYGIKNRVHQVNIDDKELACLYRKAIAFVFPSIYEGFGIPILEAFSCGCPVICSNTSSLPEIAGNAALYFDPLKKRQILNKIEEICASENIRQSLIKKGYNQLKKFSWEKTYQKTKEIYKSVL